MTTTDPKLIEPVAWMYGINAYTYQLPDWAPDKALEVPLYATPQAAALAASGADRMREALEECLRQIEKYAEFFCEVDFDLTVDLARQALGEPQ